MPKPDSGPAGTPAAAASGPELVPGGQRRDTSIAASGEAAPPHQVLSRQRPCRARAVARELLR